MLKKGGDSFQPQPSTWDLILQYCPENEIDEVKRMLGTSLVEQAVDIHCEVNVLLEIWLQIRDDTDEIILSGKTPLRSFLAEPPHVRERLIQEIKFFLSHLKKETSNNLTETGQKHSRLIEYVASNSDDIARNRPQSALHVSDGIEAPLRTVDERKASSLSSELEKFTDQINASDIEGITKNLRKLLEEECEHCHSDLKFLQKCLEDEEYFFRSIEEQQAKPLPSLKELREFGSQLEKEYLSDPRHSIPSDLALSSPKLTPLPPAEPKPLYGMSLNRASKVRHSPLTGSIEHK